MQLKAFTLLAVLASGASYAEPVFYPDRQLKLHKSSCSISNSLVEDYAADIVDDGYALPSPHGVNKLFYPAGSDNSYLLGQLRLKNAETKSTIATGTAKQLSQNKGELSAVKTPPVGSHYFKLILVSKDNNEDVCYYNSETFQVFEKPEIESVDVSPTEAESGTRFEFSTELKYEIPPDYKVQVDHGSGYKTMSDEGGNIYSYKGVANTVGDDRAFNIRVVDDRGDVVADGAGTYSVTEKEEQQYRPNLTIISASSEFVVGEDVCLSFKAEDENGNVKQLEVNFDSDPQHIPEVYSYASNTFNKTVQLCHSYQESRSYAVTARLIDHTGRFDSERVDITVSAIVEPEIESIGVTPKVAVSGSLFDFSAGLKSQLPPDYEVQVDHGDGFKTMSDEGGNAYSYKGTANTVGDDRAFNIRVVNDSGDVIDDDSGTYTVTEKDEPQYSPELTIGATSTTIKVGERFCLVMTAQDKNCDLRQTNINFGDDPLHIPVTHSYPTNSCNETVRPCHHYEEAGSYTVTAKLFDHTNRFDTKSINITVSDKDEPVDEPPVISDFFLDVDENGRVTGSFEANHASEQVRLKAEYSESPGFDNAKTLLFNDDQGLQSTGSFDFWIEPGSSWNGKTMYVRLLAWNSDGSQTSPPPVDSVLIPGASGEILLSVDEEKSDIPPCKSYKSSKYCVPADTQITVALKVDSDQQIKSIEVNKDGSNDSPVVYSGDNLSDGYALINLSYSEAKYFSASASDWAKDIELSAVAISENGLRSEKAVLAMRLYSYSSFAEAEEEKARITQEKERLTQDKEANEQFAIDKRQECLDTSGGIKLPENLDTTLKPNDSLVYNQGGIPTECAPFNRTQHREMFNRWASGGAAVFKPTVEAIFAGNGMRDSTTWECVNYPAIVRAQFIDSDGEVNYLPDADGVMVNNYRHKEYVMEQLGVTLHDEFRRLGMLEGLAPLCKAGDSSELTRNQVYEIFKAHPEFEPTYQLFLKNVLVGIGTNSIDLRGQFLNGQTKAAMEILKGYADIVIHSPETIKNVVDGTLKMTQFILNGEYETLYTKVSEGVVALPAELAELGKDALITIKETVPLLPSVLAQWTPNDAAFYSGYFFVHIAHEFAPTSKIKVLKLLKHARLPKWLTDAHVFTRFAALKVVPPNRFNKVLAKLSPSESNWVTRELLGKKTKYYSDAEIELLQKIKNNDRNWVIRILKGRAFDNYRKGAYPYREVLVCKIPSCGKIGDSAYYRLDGLDLDAGRIISRKYTQLDLINEKTGKGYVDELLKKYPENSVIASTPINDELGIAGKALKGAPVLEIPTQRNGVSCDIPPLVKVARYICDYIKEINEKRKNAGKATVTINTVDIDIELELELEI